jgi:hypothetical protein
MSTLHARLTFLWGRIRLPGAAGLIATLLVAAFAASSLAEEPAPRFLFAFGGEGSGAGQFNVARGVAVNLSSSDVYVVDQGNQRVQEFNPWGAFVGMFGKEVNETKDGNAGATEPEKDLCTQKEVEEEDVKCKMGATGEGGGQLHTPEGVAVDNGESSTSRGDVYVADFGNHRVEKFTPTGEFVLTFGKEVNETIDGKAGATEEEENVCTAASKDHCKAGKAGTGEDEFEWTAGNYIAVGSTGTVYVGDENRVQEFEPTGQHKGQITLSSAGKVSALAVNASGDVYVRSAALEGVHEYNGTGGELAAFDSGSEAVEAVALNPAGDLFVGERPGEKRVQIIEYSPTGTQLASFGAEGLGEGSASTGIAATESGTVYVSEHTSPFKVAVFGKLPPGEPPLVAPSIDAQSVTNLGVTEAVVGAQIDPHFLGTKYYVEYGTSTEYSLGKVPAPPGTVLGGGMVQSDQPASVTLSGLTPGTVYHFRFVAQSEDKKGETRTTYGADRTFTPFASSGLAGLPDGRVYEQVSPLEANGNGAGGITRVNEFNVGYGLAESAGNRVFYFQRGSFGETRSGYDVYSVSTREPTGWKTSAALPPGCAYNASNFSGEKPTALLLSADFSHLVFGAPGGFGAGNCLEPSAENPEALNRGLYRTAVDAEEPEVWLTKPTITSTEEKEGAPGPTPNPIIEESQSLVGGSPDLDTVYFTFFGTLVPEDKTRAPHVDASPGTSAWGFYEWREGALRSAGILPNEAGEPAKGEPDPYGAVPAATREERGEEPFTPSELDNEVSKEGTTAFFVSPDPKYASEAGTPTELYAREQEAGNEARTVLVSRDELEAGKPAPGAGHEEAVVPVNSSYVFASPDGSRVFFASEDRLTEAAPSGSGVKEYELNLDTNELTYLPDFAEPTSAPFSSILASSEDGSHFIFENTAAHKLELWERSPGEEEHVTELATFSTPSSPTFEARAVKDGDGTAFVLRTNAVLSGGFNDGSATQQVYRYVTGGKLTCVSCAPPDGTAQSEALEFRSARVLADEGARVFFTSAEQLLARAPGDGVENVYEWEQDGTGGCGSEEREGGCIYLIASGTSPNPSFLIDSSESGDDVFFATTQGLVKGDSGESYTVYDARVDGGFPEAAPPAECVESCRPPSVAPTLAAPLSTALGPSGNLTPPQGGVLGTAITKPPTQKQKLADALKACKKKPKKKRVGCESQARKKYGPKAKAKKTPKKTRQPRRRHN